MEKGFPVEAVVAYKRSSKRVSRFQMQKLMSDALELGKCKTSAMLEFFAQVLFVRVVSHPVKRKWPSIHVSQPTEKCNSLDKLSHNLKMIWHKAVQPSQTLNWHDGVGASANFTFVSAISTACKFQLLSWLSLKLMPGLYLPVKSNMKSSKTEKGIRLRPSGVQEPSASALALAQEVAASSTVGWSGFIRPVDKVWEVSSNFGPRWGRHHNEVDLAAPLGEPVLAADSGEVTFAGWESGGYGYLVEITHRDGWKTLYAHNSEIFTWQGDHVHRGQCIASVGATGRATGPHLHWEIRNQHGSPVNPADHVEL